jgi:hypothetical protein
MTVTAWTVNVWSTPEKNRDRGGSPAFIGNGDPRKRRRFDHGISHRGANLTHCCDRWQPCIGGGDALTNPGLLVAHAGRRQLQRSGVATASSAYSPATIHAFSNHTNGLADFALAKTGKDTDEDASAANAKPQNC